MNKKRILISSIAMAVLVLSAASGQNLVVKRFGEKDSLQKFAPNTSVVNVVGQGRVLSASSAVSSLAIDIIVELSTSATPTGPGSKQGPATAQQQTLFLDKVKSVSSSARVSRQFSRIVNAVAMSVSRSELSEIALLPGVRRISEDKKVNASAAPVNVKGGRTLSQSTNSIGTGKGVKVGVIDSGIDYMHEALGGGFGPGFKVVGGYDFVNNDPDPRDDNGHGTHVAGIISGNSPTLKSLAPDASLFAYKVLDASGSGTTSAVVAAIEQAIEDSVEVLNISLGSTAGDPDDILSHAVDAAVEKGILVVAAAGNDGEYNTISSPGAAREALTVGSAGPNNSVSAFSSKGPSNRNYGIKPDLVGPGESIISAKMGGGYVAMSGTSMAAPAIAAAGAVLRESHPEWSARDIRDELLAFARDIRLPVFAQGKGVLDALTLSSVRSFVTPASLTFGFDDPSVASWTRVDSMTLTNVTSGQRTYSLKNSNERGGISVRFAPDVVSLSPGEKTKIAVELNAQNNLLPDNTVLREGYSGKLYVLSDADTTVVPYVFFKGTLFQLSFSETPLEVLIHDSHKELHYFTPTSTFLSALLPSSVYDVVTIFSGSAYVVHEDIDTHGSIVLNVERREANHIVNIMPGDEHGNALVPAGTNTSYSSIEVLMNRQSGISDVFLGGGDARTASLVQKKYFSDVSNRYTFGYALNVQYGTPLSYTFDAELDSGIVTSQSLRFAPSDLKRIDFKYDIDSTTSRAFPITWSSFVQLNNVIAVTYYNGNDIPLRYPFVQTGYYSRRVSPKFPIFHFREAYKY